MTTQTDTPPNTAATSTTWRIDQSRSELRFLARRTGMTVRGRFPDVRGSVNLDLDRLEDSSVDAVVGTRTIEPAMAAMKGLLLSDSFLAVEEFPEVRFRSTRIEADGDRYAVHGELTFRGQTREITLEARLSDVDVFGKDRSVRIEAHGRADRLIADEELEVSLSILAVPAEAGATASIADQPATADQPPAAPAIPGNPSAPLGTADRRRGAPPIHIVALLGSLRRGSFNRSLLRATQEVAPEGVDIEAFSLADVPFYDGDLEAEGDPTAVRALKAAIAEADAVLMVTPEYNQGLPAVTKNAIDWASRPPFDSPLAGKPVLLMGATTGRSATKYALKQAADSLTYAQAMPFEERYGVSRVTDLVDDDDRLTDPRTRADLRRLLGTFAASVRGSIATTKKAA